MFDIKIKKYIDESFKVIEDYCNDNLLLTNRDLQLDDWILLASFIVELDNEYCMLSVDDILKINKEKNTDILRDAGNFSIVLIRLRINNRKENKFCGVITEGEDKVFYELPVNDKNLYNSLLFPKSFTWERDKLDMAEDSLRPSLEELPVFIHNLCKTRLLFMSAGHGLLNSITSIYNGDDDEAGAVWYDEKRKILFNLFTKVTDELGGLKH